ncbi:hypothetical protein GCK72_022448 [Caenorhabditis remanei]|uniref:Uncharacterized protein n=1 Tax=Caenorhabditis remanei TaxID=31234 RepID=A0A6A5FTT4_CAERE|nr:hypothetical protein GCK72_022448 [Caenorhabditis remanei]KAF1745997.1 hypothetical protein GCK72_022448 [Caenorhabditis remanei]
MSAVFKLFQTKSLAAKNSDSPTRNLYLNFSNNNSQQSTAIDANGNTLEPKEFTFHCLICDYKSPVVQLKHRQECINSVDNRECPFCHHKRRNYLIEDHIEQCARATGKSTIETHKAIFTIRFSSQEIDDVLAQERNRILNEYKIQLVANYLLQVTPCLVCETSKLDENIYIHTVEGETFRRNAGNYLKSKIIPHYVSLLEIQKEEILQQKEALFVTHWRQNHPEDPVSGRERANFMAKFGDMCEKSNEESVKKKMTEMNNTINEHAKILCKEMITVKKYLIFVCTCRCKPEFD